MQEKINYEGFWMLMVKPDLFRNMNPVTDPTLTPGSGSATLDALNDGILITSPLPCRPNKKNIFI